MGHLLRSYDCSCADKTLLTALSKAGCADVAAMLAANPQASKVTQIEQAGIFHHEDAARYILKAQRLPHAAEDCGASVSIPCTCLLCCLDWLRYMRLAAGGVVADWSFT